ncbi:MAG: 16S rRNA (cytidine(1402)-2'-O)-methyltransferase [Acidimicrobiales bacterium]|jgi:16S rRNA (cytidine1402-2'-O)-methyltransferase
MTGDTDDCDGPVDTGEDPAGPVDTGHPTVGALVVVGTPIGNLDDLSPRAVDALASADVIYCEDTRHSRKLLSHAGISGVPLRSLHEYNEVDRADEVVAAVAAGRTAALVSDAGMPAVSDPGARVVAAVAGAGLAVTVVPGPSAVLAALVGSGLPTDRFCFEGFLPRSGRERAERLAAVAVEPRTSVLFEAPVRTAATLRDLAAACGGDRPVAVARELTKLHEEIWRGTLASAVEWAGEGVRGEVVLVLGGAPEPAERAVDDGVLSRAVAERLAAGARTRGAVDATAAEYGVPRRRVYDLALRVIHAGPEETADADSGPDAPA